MKKRKLLKGAVIGVALGALANFFFNPKKGAANRKKVQKVSNDVIKRLKSEISTAKDLTKPHYEQLVHKVIADFKEDKSLSKESWDAITDELKARWQDINTEMKDKAAKKVAAKKTTKKS